MNFFFLAILSLFLFSIVSGECWFVSWMVLSAFYKNSSKNISDCNKKELLFFCNNKIKVIPLEISWTIQCIDFISASWNAPPKECEGDDETEKDRSCELHCAKYNENGFCYFCNQCLCVWPFNCHWSMKRSHSEMRLSCLQSILKHNVK